MIKRYLHWWLVRVGFSAVRYGVVNQTSACECWTLRVKLFQPVGEEVNLG